MQHIWKCSIVEKNLRIHLIPMRHFYGAQLLNKSVKSLSVTFHQLLQPSEERFLTINDPDKTSKKNNL